MEVQWILFAMGKKILFNAKYFHFSCHATWLLCKNPIECHKTKTKLMTLANQKGYKQFSEPIKTWDNSPFPSSPKPLHQSEAWCTTIHMKMSLICKWMKSHFHMKEWSRLALRKRFKESRKWPLTCRWRKARENVCERVKIGFGFTSDWMKNWCESFQPIAWRSRCKTNSFSTQMKIACFLFLFSSFQK